MPQKLEAAVIQQMSDVIAPPRKKVIEADDFVALQNQTFTEMRADEPRTASHEHLHCNHRIAVLHPPTYTVLPRRVSTTRRMPAVVLTCR